MLISFGVTLQLICVFVFVYSKSRSSHDIAEIINKFYCNLNVSLSYNVDKILENFNYQCGEYT